ncbi:PBECR4 domain-containing protein [Amedibacillus sp. YH-ame6]
MINRNDYATVLRCAEQYKRELADTKMLFVYENRHTKEYGCFEAAFLSSNFKHLTGIIYPFKNEEIDTEDLTDGAVHFFNLALRKRLDIDKCKYKSDGTTQLKLQILQMIMNIKKTARMIGDFNHSKLHIMADKMCGSVATTLAFTKNEIGDYCPSSALREDIRNLVTDFHPIIAIYQKDINEDTYTRVCYKSQKLDHTKLKNMKEELITI